MKYGMNLLLWTATVNEETYPLLEQIKGWGFNGVELPIFDMNPSTFEQVGATLKNLGLECTGVTICTAEANPIAPDPAVRQAGLTRLKGAIDCLAAAGGKILCGPIHSALGIFTGHGPTSDEWKWAQEILHAAADYAQGRDILLAVEPLNRFECYFLNCAEDAARFCREARHSHLKMMYDTFHAHIEEENVVKAIASCRDQLVHVHVSESNRATPGEGQVSFSSTFAALKATGYDGWLTIEAFGLALPELAAATKIWRRMYPTEEYLATIGLAFLKKQTTPPQPKPADEPATW